jgi:Raf kinase inhibitor-like YbhB/YbcL family protein
MIACVFGLAACGSEPAANEAAADSSELRLVSSAFGDGDALPAQFTCDGDNISPPLEFRSVPAGTKSFVVTMDDPDAPSGTYRHWGAYNIPAYKPQLRAGAGLPSSGSAQQVVNSKGEQAYTGPCPPEGSGPHRYRFKLYALSKEQLELAPDEGVASLQTAASTHALGEATLTANYERP